MFIPSEEIARIIKNEPVQLFNLLYRVSIGEDILDDECYYEILRLRNNIKNKYLKSVEMVTILQDVFSSGFAYKFVKLLEEHELLEKVFPSIDNLIKVDGGHYHNETVYTHVLGALRALDKNKKIPWFVKLAALYHDCGKNTWEFSDEGKKRFLNHAQKGGPIVEKDLKALGFDDTVVDYVKTIVMMHMQQIDGPHSIRKLDRIYREHDVDPKYFFWVRYADNKGSAVYKTDFSYYWELYRKFKKTLYVKKEPSVKDLDIDGHILMKHFHKKPGKWLGMLLSYLFVGVQERGYINEQEALLKEAEKFMEWYKGDKND